MGEGPKATAIGAKAAGLLSDSRQALFLLKLVQVKNVKVKVVHGFLFRLKLVVGATSCMREEEEEYEAALARCSETNDDEVWGSTQICDVDVLLRAKRTNRKADRKPDRKPVGKEDGVESGGERG